MYCRRFDRSSARKLHVSFFFLAFTTCSLPVLAIGRGPSVAQSAGSSAEQQIDDRYRGQARMRIVRFAAEKPSK